MDVSEAIETRLEVRDYADRPVDDDAKRAILDAARLAPSGKNFQHWQFVLVEDALEDLASMSTTGSWIDGADFAVVVLTDPRYAYHEIDAGRAITHMQFEAWERGVGSCIYTGFDERGMRDHFDVPDGYAITAVVGFGYPEFDVEDVRGRKDREPLSDVVYDGRFGQATRFD